jgi:hypothetical protein
MMMTAVRNHDYDVEMNFLFSIMLLHCCQEFSQESIHYVQQQAAGVKESASACYLSARCIKLLI